MCGICGFISDRPISNEQLKTMNDTMVRRGPDDSGEVIFAFGNDRHLGLAHRRLSILDLSEKGHQPFYSDTGDIVVVFNGEIYNFQVLKTELSDYPFISNCDTEVIVAAYRKWGTDFVAHLDGMFAIALFDREQKLLILARDRIGKKPLYYYRKNGDFVFGSVLKALMAFPGFERNVNKDVLPRYLVKRYIAEDDCIFEDVRKLRPGEMLIFDGDVCVTKTYWSLLEQYDRARNNTIGSFSKAKKQLEVALTEAVRRRMIADVPVGAFLSGGYDSSLVTAVAQKLSDKPLKTFSIGFTNKAFDEAPYAEAVAKLLGTDHTVHYVTEDELFQLVASIPEYYDEPFADSSQIPSMLVAEIAKKDVTVVLTGDGGDEFFCGYNVYDKLYLAQKLEPAAKMLRLITNRKAGLLRRLPFAVRAILENDKDSSKTQFGKGNYEKVICQMLDCGSSNIHFDERNIRVKNWQIRRMLLDSVTYLPDNNLCKVDRATMKYSLEARNPLLDVGLIETAFRIPHRFKYHRRNKKHILKELTYDYIPRELMERPKQGFAPPVDQWLRGPLMEDLKTLTSQEYLQKQRIFNPEFTAAYVRDYLHSGDKGAYSGQNPSNIVWPLYVFQKWYQHYIEEIN